MIPVRGEKSIDIDARMLAAGDDAGAAVLQSFDEDEVENDEEEWKRLESIPFSKSRPFPLNPV